MKTQNQRIRSKIKLLKKFIRKNKDFDGFISIPDFVTCTGKRTRLGRFTREQLCSRPSDFYYRNKPKGLCVYADDVESVKYAQECFELETSSL